jgi:hypothetical protein
MGRSRRRRSLCAGVFVGLVLGVPTMTWAQAPDRRGLPEAFTTEIGATWLRVPLSYNPVISRGKLVLFPAMIDGFGPHDRSTATHWPMSELYEAVGILLLYVARYDSIFWMEGYLVVLRKHRVEPSFPSDRLSGSDEPVPSGLRMLQTEPEQPPRGRKASDWFAPEALLNSGPEAIICASPFSVAARSQPDPLWNLRCKHLFVHRGVQMKLNHERRHLVRWREIRDGSVALIESFVRGAEAAPAP